jgi:hypothetical protein
MRAYLLANLHDYSSSNPSVACCSLPSRCISLLLTLCVQQDLASLILGIMRGCTSFCASNINFLRFREGPLEEIQISLVVRCRNAELKLFQSTIF